MLLRHRGRQGHGGGNDAQDRRSYGSGDLWQPDEDLSEGTGLTHDIGHTWNGHEGERISTAIGRLRNCGYTVHGAMGAYIYERESIVDRAIEAVKQFNPKASEAEIREFMRYVIDGVVSHNGEGTVGVIIPKNKTAEEMAEEIQYLKEDPVGRLSGKYFEQTMPKYIMTLFQDANKKENRLLFRKRRKVALNVSKDNMIYILANYADVPADLISYIRTQFKNRF